MSEITAYLEAKGYEFKEIGQSESRARNCPFCEGERSFSVSNDPEKQVYNCHRCGAHGNLKTLKRHFNDMDNSNVTSLKKIISRKEYITPPADKAEEYHKALFDHQNAFDFLKKRGLTLETIQHFKLGYRKNGQNEYISIPYYEDGKLINFKYRNLVEKKFHREKDAKSALFNQDCLKGITEVLITEGEFDAMMCWQTGIKNVISGSNGAKSFEPEWVDQLEGMVRINLWYDNDDAGREGLANVIKRLGADRCWVIQEEGFKDANEYFLCNETYDLAQAKQVPIANVIHFWDSVFKIFEHEKNLSSEIKTPWKNVNRLIGNVEGGDLVTLSAVPKTGKSTLALNIATYNAKRGHPIFYYCLEMRPERLAKKVIEAEGMLCGENFTRVKALEVAEKIYEIPLYFGYNYKNIDQETVFETIRTATRRFGLKLVIFDNLHYLVRSLAHVSAEVGNVTRGFKLLAEELQIPLILIAQPRKVEDGTVMTMNDLKDSSSIGADSDQVIILWRKKTKANPKSVLGQESSFESRTLVRVDASRYTAGGDTSLYCKGEYSLFTEMERI